MNPELFERFGYMKQFEGGDPYIPNPKWITERNAEQLKISIKQAHEDEFVSLCKNALIMVPKGG